MLLSDITTSCFSVLPLKETDKMWMIHQTCQIDCASLQRGPIATSGGRIMAVFGDEQDTGLSPNCKAHCVCSTQCAVYHQIDPASQGQLAWEESGLHADECGWCLNKLAPIVPQGISYTKEVHEQYITDILKGNNQIKKSVCKAIVLHSKSSLFLTTEGLHCCTLALQVFDFSTVFS